ncbi:MAG TPA: TatD family hydrolase [Candidatus Binataceae bacterium]|nr:TatD family hydrolase [Candidatus Binataceae bacterium]
MIDSHIHLDADQYADSGGLIKRARAAGVKAIVVPGITPASNRRVLELAAKHPGFVRAAIGFHPERFELTDADLEATVAMAREHREDICAIGEVGLPWYGELARRTDVQERARKTLACFAALASELDLALILHCPHETAMDALAIIKSTKVRRAVFHWHKSDAATTRAILDAGYFISLTPEVAYRDRDRELARIVPLHQMMVETDGPWPYGGPFESRRTEPSFIPDVISAIAQLRSIAVEMVARAIAFNARTLFGISTEEGL